MTRRTFRDWVIATRPWAIPASAMPIIVTLAYLFWKGAEINWYFGAWALVNMVLFHIAGNLWSDYRDFVNNVDREYTPGGSVLPTGQFTAKEIRNFSLVVLAIGVAGGVSLVALTGLDLLWIGITGAVLTLLYPYMKYNALGNLDILLTFAVLPVLGTSFVVTGEVDWSMLWAAVPVGLITDAILHANNTRDIATDSVAQIRTLALKVGHKGAARIYSFEVVFPFAWIAICSIAGLMPLSTIIIFLTLPVAMGCSRTIMKSIKGGTAIITDLDVRTSNLQLMFSLLLTLAMIIDKVL